ncbi:MAG: S-layer homology domain-containing protein [Clostridiaceae bacterium]|nr:S-layer homology domain-containing protein [Clostridiaceae bacterium]
MSNLKKVLALVLVLALSLTMFAGAIETVLPYDDVEELTAEQLDSLKLLYALGVIKGDGDSVNPTDTLTRGELAAILYRLYTGDAEEKYVSTYSTDCPYFDDVEAGKWYVPYVNWAYIKGVIAGYGNGNFGPEDNVTGVQAATMLSRLVGYEIGSENWELVSRKYAIELGLDDGVASKDLFGTDLSRGDMIVMVANVLDCYEVGTKVTLAEKIFDLEIINGAILLGADKLGSTPYSVFAFKDEISGNVKYFITDLLSIEEAPTVDEIGQKYTLYVAKTTEVNGYKVLYAAYEEDQNAYYATVTGTVDDGKLNTTNPADKGTYLLNLLDDHCVAYVNGAVVANNAADAFAAFKAAYGVRNSAAYKLIDNDGDGKYEYIFIEKLTLATMKTTEVVANVVAYNSITGAYTLSDGNTYVPGQYWAVDANKNITGLVDATQAVVGLIGEKSFTASSVQYKFTIENGKYIMLADVCDETYFAGNYVLSMGLVGTSTYKGMQYVQFLTEDNTSLYAYVANVNHTDAKVFANWVDNSVWTQFAYMYELFYVNAYGDDTVELFTPGYINSHEAYAYIDGNNQSVVTVNETSKFEASPAVDAVYAWVANVETDGVYAPNLPFDSKNVYMIVTEYTAGTQYYWNSKNGTYITAADAEYANLSDADKAATYTLKPVIFTKATYEGYFKAAAKKLAAGEELTEWVAYKVADGQSAKTVGVSIAADFDTTNLQIFKAYGTWYMQNYGDLTADNATVYFTADGKDWEVEYDADTKAFYDVKTGAIFSVGAADAETIAESIEAIIRAIDTDADFIYDRAVALNTSKGVVFAWGTYPYNFGDRGPIYQWRAYNFDEFNVASFGEGGMNDDWSFSSQADEFYVPDEMIFANSNGQIYVKAAKVTVSRNDVLPMGWAVENSKYVIWGNDIGSWTVTGRTNKVILPNGKTEDITVPYGVNFEYGDVVYLVLNEDGSIRSFEKVSNIYEIWNDRLGDEYGIGYAADGTVTIYGKLGITYTVKIDLEKTFFMDEDGHFISSEAFAKHIAAEHCKFWVDYSDAGYNFVYCDD